MVSHKLIISISDHAPTDLPVTFETDDHCKISYTGISRLFFPTQILPDSISFQIIDDETKRANALQGFWPYPIYFLYAAKDKIYTAPTQEKTSLVNSEYLKGIFTSFLLCVFGWGHRIICPMCPIRLDDDLRFYCPTTFKAHAHLHDPVMENLFPSYNVLDMRTRVSQFQFILDFICFTEQPNTSVRSPRATFEDLVTGFRLQQLKLSKCKLTIKKNSLPHT